MFKARSIVPLLVGLGVGFYAVKLGVDMVNKAQGAVNENVVKIVVAAREAPMGTQFTAEMLTLAEVPRALAPAQTFTDIAQVVGRVASHSLRTGGCVSEDVLAPPGSPPGLNVRIPKGYRAVAVKVDEFSSVAGFLNPGNHVDVIAVMTCRGSHKRETISRTILEDVMVAAVGQEMADPKDPGATVTRSVTLLVKPKDAAILHLADTKGKIRLALRQQEDSKSGQRGFASTGDLLDPDAETSPSGQEADWWRGLAGGLASRVAGEALGSMVTKGAQAAPGVRVAAGSGHPKPWIVTVINGSTAQQLCFESSCSTRRIGSSGARGAGLLNSGQGMGRYSDVLGHHEALPGGEPVAQSWSNPPDD